MRILGYKRPWRWAKQMMHMKRHHMNYCT